MAVGQGSDNDEEGEESCYQQGSVCGCQVCDIVQVSRPTTGRLRSIYRLSIEEALQVVRGCWRRLRFAMPMVTSELEIVV